MRIFIRSHALLVMRTSEYSGFAAIVTEWDKFKALRLKYVANLGEAKPYYSIGHEVNRWKHLVMEILGKQRRYGHQIIQINPIGA